MRKYSFANKDVANLSKKYSTPFLLFDENKIEENYIKIRKYFSSSYKNLRIDYSAKTNLEIGVLKIFNRLGARLEISGPQELMVAKKAGFAAKDAVLDTPIKTQNEIEKLIKEGIHAFYIDSLDDIKRVQSVAFKLKKKVNVVIRINPGFPLSILDLAEKYLGKFGIKEKDIPQIIEYMEDNCQNTKLIGFSTHVGSQQIGTAKHIRALRKIVAVAIQTEQLGYDIQELCIGGGYPSPTLNRKTTISLALSFLGVSIENTPEPLSAFGTKISEEFSKLTKNMESKPQLVIQPGRSLVSNSAIAIGKVMTVKENWIFSDLSTSTLPESLFFGQRKTFIVGGKGDENTNKYNVAGRGLNTADNLATNVNLSNPQVGDLLVVLDAGAYSISRANRFTILNPKVLLVTKSGIIKQIRREERYEDIIAPMEL